MKTKKCNSVYRLDHVRICTLSHGHAGDCDGPRPELTIKNAKAIAAFYKREQQSLAAR